MTLAAVPEMTARTNMPRTMTRFTVWPPCNRTFRSDAFVDSFVPHHDLGLNRDGASGGRAGIDEPDHRPDVDELVGIADRHADLRAGSAVHARSADGDRSRVRVEAGVAHVGADAGVDLR